MIDSFVQRVVNELLGNDKPSRQLAADTAGTSIRVCITDVPQSPSRIIEFMSSGLVSIIDDSERKVSCTLSGSSRSFLAVASADKENLSLKGLHIEGDVDAAMQVARLAQSLDLDWESLLEPRLGRFLTRQIGVAASAAKTIRRDFAQRSNRVIGEAMIEELRLCPSRVEMQIELERIEKLNARLDALEQRLNS